jgi:hypothetical protein
LSEQSEPKGRSGDIPASAGATASVASKRTKASKATVELEGVDQLAAHAKAAGYKVAAFRELLELTPRSKMEPSLALSK